MSKTQILELRDRRGATSSNLRNHNERMILSMLRERGPLASAEIAKSLELSAQTASIIVRSLENQGLIQRQAPIKGKVGKPQIPLTLAPKGAYAFGLRIGRRRADLVLLDLTGSVHITLEQTYRYPTPLIIERFVKSGLDDVIASLTQDQAKRIVGMGIAAPFELWNWLDGLGAPKEDAKLWLNYDFASAFANFTSLPISVANDVNLACTGELHFGIGPQFRDYLYFYIGAFVGGAVVLNGRVFRGAHGNAGAFGSILTGSATDPTAQLISSASVFPFETLLIEELGRPVNLHEEENLWQSQHALADRWITDATEAMAKAVISAVATLDINNVVVDGVFPEIVRQDFVARLSKATSKLAPQGIRPPCFEQGTLGQRAGSLGAAYHPLLEKLFAEGSFLTGSGT